MANITINETHQAHSGDIRSKISHFFDAIFGGGAKRKSADISVLDAHTLADIGIRREQLAPNYSRFSDDDQKLYWTS